MTTMTSEALPFIVNPYEKRSVGVREGNKSS